MVTINFTKTGSVQVNLDTYADEWEDGDKPETLASLPVDPDTKFQDLTDEQKIEFIKQVEINSCYEGLVDPPQEQVEITSVTL